MKIKHWQGYGLVNARKISHSTNNGITSLHIRVSGDHEQTLERNDRYDVANWLVKKFDKSFVDWRTITSVQTNLSYANGEEVCDYVISYTDPTIII